MKEIFDERMCGYRIIAIEFMEREAQAESIGRLLAQHLRQKLGYPFLDCQVPEEEAYGLPEYSIYYNQDARSFCGRWTYSEGPVSIDESGLFFALITADSPCYKRIEETVGRLLQEPNVATAILQEEVV